MATKNKQTLEDRIESAAERAAENFQQRFINWLRSSQFFDGLVNTPARIMVQVASLGVLYVWGIQVFVAEQGVVPWAITLVFLLLWQAASVRFVFNTEGVADEFQTRKRDAAYRRGYESLRRVLIGFLLLFVLVMLLRRQPGESLFAELVYRIDNYRALVIAIFLVALTSFQKYFSYGIKGEPFTVREKNKIKD
jgi:glucan phosphoethanolaminetransferase (alkaline phosphatase superfamily)